jgi:aconitate hydratase
MGVLPLQFPAGASATSLGLRGDERYSVEGLDDRLAVGGEVRVRAVRAENEVVEFEARVRIDTPIELEYYRQGGILPMVLRKVLANTG